MYRSYILYELCYNWNTSHECLHNPRKEKNNTLVWWNDTQMFYSAYDLSYSVKGVFCFTVNICYEVVLMFKTW